MQGSTASPSEIELYGPDVKLVDWKDEITADCPKPNDRVAMTDLRAAWFPDLIKL